MIIGTDFMSLPLLCLINVLHLLMTRSHLHIYEAASWNFTVEVLFLYSFYRPLQLPQSLDWDDAGWLYCHEGTFYWG